MENRDPRKEHWRPRNIEHRHQSWRSHQALHAFKIALCSGSHVLRGLRRRHFQRGFKNPTVQSVLKTRTDAGHDASACVIQQAHGAIKKCNKYRQSQQGCFGAASQNTVVHLKHVDRACQHQQIGEETENSNEPIKWSAFPAGGQKLFASSFKLAWLHK